MSPRRLLLRGAAGALLLLYAVQGIWHASAKSATFDEPVHVAAAVLSARGSAADFGKEHTPLMRCLTGWVLGFLPLSLPPEVPRVAGQTLSDPAANLAQQRFARELVFRNRVSAERILLTGRLATLSLGLLLAGLVCCWSTRMYGPGGGVFSLALYALSPTAIAHGSLVTTDMAGAAFGALAVFAIAGWASRPTLARAAAVGSALSLALLSKLSNVPLVVLGLGVCGWLVATRRVRPGTALRMALLGACAAWLLLLGAYRFEGVFQAHHLPDPGIPHALAYELADRALRHAPLPDAFVQSLGRLTAHSAFGDRFHLLGENYGSGRWHYFPLAFVVKTPTAMLVVLALLLAAAVRGRSRALRPAHDAHRAVDEKVVLCAAVLCFSAAVLSMINLGVRHILICYALLAVLGGRLVPLATAWSRRKVGAPVAVGAAVALLLAGEVLAAAPDYLAFFNLPAGGVRGGIRYLADSNLDWGQDLNGLAEFLHRRGDPEVILSYFGTAPPEYYGITYQALRPVGAPPQSDHVNGRDPAREWLAVSVTNLQGAQSSSPDTFAWLRGRPPDAMIGGSIYLYDITADADAHGQIMKLYRASGEEDKFLRERERAYRLRLRGALRGGERARVEGTARVADEPS